MVRADRRLGDRVPFATRRKRRAATAQQLRLGHLSDHALLSDLDGAAQGGIPSVTAVAVDALGIDHTNPSKQSPSPLRGEGLKLRPSAATQYLQGRVDGQPGQLPLVVARPGALDQPGRCAVAQTETWTALPGLARGAFRLL